MSTRLLAGWLAAAVVASSSLAFAQDDESSPEDAPSAEDALDALEADTDPSADSAEPDDSELTDVADAAATGTFRHIDLQAGTTLPALIGVGAELEFSNRLRLNTEVGFMPGAYVSIINGVVLAFDGYTEQTADLLVDLLENSMVVHVDVGWYPTLKDRWYFAGGMSFAFLGGSLTGKEALEAAIGIDIDTAEQGIEFDAGSNVFLITLHGGYRLPVTEAFTMRFELGVLYAAASSNSLDGPLPDRAMAKLEVVYDDWLSDIYTTYVISPMIGIWASYTL